MKPDIPKDLQETIKKIDRLEYKAYKRLQAKCYDFSPFRMRFEQVQGDAFAPPSRISVSIDLAEAGFADTFLSASRMQVLAFEDFLLRSVVRHVKSLGTYVEGSGRSGLIGILEPSQKILKRNALLISGKTINLIMFVGLPADGRQILGNQCIRMFSEILPKLWANSMLAPPVDLAALKHHIHTLEDYDALQGILDKNGWVSFVANGSLLPRVSGISDLPLKENGVKFVAPQGLTATIELPHRGRIEGMPVPKGITLIVGGGFHGKSTLLVALQSAVYPHVPGDGREIIATSREAVKIRAEEGRVIRAIDLSGFMDNLPLVPSIKEFSTQSASGSTSQAVNIIEAIEAGADLLLMDEDTCASNFMIRDSRMQKLVHADNEPIIPYIDRVEEIASTVSSIIVMGGSGDYFEVADQVIAMEWFKPYLVTQKAKTIAKEFPGSRKKETKEDFPSIKQRCIEPRQLTFNRGKKDHVIKVNKLFSLILGTNEVDTRFLEQLVEEGQLEACGWIIKKLHIVLQQNKTSNIAGLKNIYQELEKAGMDFLTSCNTGRLSLPRLQEVMAVVNRIR